MDFWYEFDLFFNPDFYDTPPTPQQLKTVQTYTPESQLLANWFLMRDDRQNYPNNFEDFIRNSPNIISSINYLSEHQIRIIKEKLGNDEYLIEKAFQDFGQGVLYDDLINEQTLRFRRPNDERVHIMATVDYGYPRWYAFCRAASLLSNESIWLSIARYVALAHSLHKRLEPKQSSLDGQDPHNPGSSELVEQLTPMFRSADFDRLDGYFDNRTMRKIIRV
jgi:hypothetical protein